MPKLITAKDVIITMFGQYLEPTSHFAEGADVLGIREGRHTGTDYPFDEGTPFVAPEDIVIRTQVHGVRYGGLDYNGPHAYGNSISFFVKKWSLSIAVCHNRFGESVVDVGQELTKGAPMSQTGDTGLSSGPHAHISAAFGDHSTLQQLLDNAFDFENFSIYVDDNGYIDHEATNGPHDEVIVIDEEIATGAGVSFTIPAGAILYDRDGNPYASKTTVEHHVTSFTISNGRYGFYADWLIGVDHAYYDPGSVSSSMVGSTITIPAGSTLYNGEGVAYSIATDNSHTVTVASQNGSLLMFYADWLIGVDHAYVYKNQVN